MLNTIELLVKDNLLGHACFVKDDTGNMALCEITRVDFYISNSGMGINLHLKRNGNQNFPHCVNAYGYRTSSNSTLPYGYLSTEDYVKYSQS